MEEAMKKRTKDPIEGLVDEVKPDFIDDNGERVYRVSCTNGMTYQSAGVAFTDRAPTCDDALVYQQGQLYAVPWKTWPKGRYLDWENSVCLH